MLYISIDLMLRTQNITRFHFISIDYTFSVPGIIVEGQESFSR